MVFIVWNIADSEGYEDEFAASYDWGGGGGGECVINLETTFLLGKDCLASLDCTGGHCCFIHVTIKSALTMVTPAGIGSWWGLVDYPFKAVAE